MTSPDFTDQAIVWTRTGDGEYPYQAQHAGAVLHLRVNDFPAEPLYTLLVDYRPTLDLDDWPAPWLRPAPTPDQLRTAGTAQFRRGRVDAIVIADWAHRLCIAPPGPARSVLAALDVLTLDEPPPGLSRWEVVEAAGVVSAIHLTPNGGGPTHAELSALLGPGLVGPPDANGLEPVVFRVEVPDAPFSCEVIARYESPAPSKGVQLHRPATDREDGQARRGR